MVSTVLEFRRAASTVLASPAAALYLLPLHTADTAANLNLKHTLTCYRNIQAIFADLVGGMVNRSIFFFIYIILAI